MYSAEEHERQIKRLIEIDSRIVMESRVKALLDGVRNKELSIDDVIQYTNISEAHLYTLLNVKGES